MKNSKSLTISVIIPFCYRKGDSFCIVRLQNTIECFKGLDNVEVVIFDTSVNRERYLSCLEKFVNSNIKYFYNPEHSIFSPGKTRNSAVEKAQGDYIFFCDADLLCPISFVELLLNFCNKLAEIGPQAFAMFPCLYLSEKTTLSIISGQKPDYSFYHESYLKGELEYVDGIAVASSCLLIKRQWFYKIGAFRELFLGHGYEDFDLIHRLAAYYPAGKLPEDYTLDDKQQFPANYRGFRRYFSYYSLPHLLESNFMLHQWHNRPLTHSYHRRRKNNEAIFANILNELSLTAIDGIIPFDSKNTLPEYQQWIVSLMQKYSLDKELHPGIFKWKQGVVRPAGTWQRKLRKLILNPQKFIRDMG